MKILDIDELREELAQLEANLDLWFQRAESAEQHAELCRIESEDLAFLKDELAREIEANGQFGAGA